MRKSLKELDGQWRMVQFGKDEPASLALRFRCPIEGHAHSILVPVTDDGAKGTWKRNGPNLDTLTLAPSINCAPLPLPECGAFADKCRFHGIIEEGYVV